MEITLNPEIEDIIRRKISSGEYDSADQVISKSLELLDQWDRRKIAEANKFHEAIQVGLDQANRGDFSTLTMEEVKQEARRRHELKRKTS